MKPGARYLALSALLLVSAVLAHSQDAPAAPPAQAQAAAPATAQAAPVPPDSTELELIHYVKAKYPGGALAQDRQGQVTVRLVVNESGDVESAEIVSGDPIFQKAALDAVRKWKYKPFFRGGHPIKVRTQVDLNFNMEGQVRDIPPSPSEAVRAPEVPQPAGEGWALKPVAVPQGVTQGLLIHRVAPTYPPSAISSRIQGQVVLRAIIGKDGQIKDLHPVSGPPPLIQSAMDAVQQ